MPNKVYFTPVKNDEPQDIIIRKLKDLLNAADFDTLVSDRDFVAVKTHFGEKKSITHIPPWFFKPLSARIKQLGGQPFITETSTLYRGQRTDAVTHLMLAHMHGFTVENTGMPIIMADGLKGDFETEVEIQAEHEDKVAVAGLIAKVHAIVSTAHPTGHIGMGFGGTIKNLGMGLSSRKGKLVQHSTVSPSVDPEKCTACHNCMDWCPEDAIIEKGDVVEIVEKRCIGCGECLTECRFDAVKYNWRMDNHKIQKLCAAHALGVIKGKKAFHINYLINFTKDCDCLGAAKERAVDDIGVLVSRDPVALDEASITLIEERNKKPLTEITYDSDPRVQTKYGEEIGLGSREYELTEV
jgi:uncharacterized Fe-S center protein